MLEIMKASAGSGKTYRLARKYITLLLDSDDRYAYRHILAVTFTNKATDEMKSRILKELHVLATDPAASDYHGFFVPERIPTDSDLPWYLSQRGSLQQPALPDEKDRQ